MMLRHFDFARVLLPRFAGPPRFRIWVQVLLLCFPLKLWAQYNPNSQHPPSNTFSIAGESIHAARNGEEGNLWIGDAYGEVSRFALPPGDYVIQVKNAGDGKSPGDRAATFHVVVRQPPERIWLAYASYALLPILAWLAWDLTRVLPKPLLQVYFPHKDTLAETSPQVTEQRDHPLPSCPEDMDVKSADEQFMAKAVDCMEENFSNPHFGVEDLADALAVSPRQLLRKMNAFTGQGPAQWIRNFRLERAAWLLTRGAGNVSQIGDAVGFRNTRHFSTLFRKTYGMNPSEFARHHAEQNTPKNEVT